MTKIDPITFEVLRNAFRSFCTEGNEFMKRVAYSPTITEGADSSAAFLDGKGRLISHGKQDQAPHLGTFEESIKVIKERYIVQPGDVYIMNDCYLGGTHRNDVKIIRPIFVDNELYAFAATLCHWPDVGGPIPGSFNPQAIECYAEGLNIPPMKLYEHEELVKPVYELIMSNIRCSGERIAEIYAQYGGGQLIERRVKEYITKFGKETVKMAMEESINYSRRIFKEEVKTLPDGIYEWEDFGDKDEMHPEHPRIRVHCKMTIENDNITLDFSGSDPSPRGSWGFARPALLSACYDGTMHSFPHLIPMNHGITSSIKVISVPGTCVDCVPPTPVSGYCSGAYEKVSCCVMGCWAQALQSIDSTRIFAGTINLENVCTGGIHPKTGVEFVSYLWLEGGQGARTYSDGPNFLMMNYIGGSSNQSLEVHERCYAMLYDKVECLQDSCGDGKFRGGMGLQRSFILTGDTILSIHGDREEITPNGLCGGSNGGPNKFIINPGEPNEHNLGMFAANVLGKKGYYVYFGSNGGGGIGNPLDRDPKLVLEDVIDEYISLKKARDVYGVVINIIDKDALDYEIDWEQTKNVRADLAKKQFKYGLGAWEINKQGEKIKVKGINC